MAAHSRIGSSWAACKGWYVWGFVGMMCRDVYIIWRAAWCIRLGVAGVLINAILMVCLAGHYVDVPLLIKVVALQPRRPC